MILRLVRFDCLHGAWLISPGVVDEQLCGNPEHLKQRSLAVFRIPGNVTHGVQSHLFQLFGVAAADPPEVRQRLVIPQLFPESHFVQFCNADAVCICRHLFRHNVHGDFRKVQIRSDAGSRCDAGFTQYRLYHFHGKLVRRAVIGFQISCHVHKDFVNGIDVDIFRRNIPEIDLVDLCADLHIVCHLGLGGNEIQFQRRILCKL